VELERTPLSQVAEVYRKLLGAKVVRIKKIVMPDGKVLEGDDLKKLMEAQDGSKRK